MLYTFLPIGAAYLTGMCLTLNPMRALGILTFSFTGPAKHFRPNGNTDDLFHNSTSLFLALQRLRSLAQDGEVAVVGKDAVTLFAGDFPGNA